MNSLKPLKRIFNVAVFASLLYLPAQLVAQSKKKPQDTIPVTLVIGSPAPQLKVMKWLKGTPTDSFERGKVYVVEFWATWCGPCIRSMPHLSELAKKYNDATFISVNGSERTNADLQKATDFVNASGDMMAYNVAFADQGGDILKQWLDASGTTGIPAAFVVDTGGRIGWMGMPFFGLDEAVELALSGRLTAAEADAINQKWKQSGRDGVQIEERLKLALKEQRFEDAIKTNDSLLQKWPSNGAYAAGTKYALLTKVDPVAAKAYGEKLLQDQHNAPVVLKRVATTIVEPNDIPERRELMVKISGTPDYELAKRLLLQALKCSERDKDTDKHLKKIEKKEK